MTEILLVIVIVLLLVLQYLYVRESSKKEHRYIKALLAKNLPEMAQSDLLEKDPEEAPKVDTLIPSEQAEDSLFDRMISKQLKENHETIAN